MLLPQFGDNWPHHRLAQQHIGRYPERAGDISLERVEGRSHLGEPGQHAQAMLIGHLPGRRRTHALARAHQQGLSEIAFQRRQLLAHRRLGHAQSPSCSRERARFHRSNQAA